MGFYALADHTSMTGRRFEVGYAAAFEAFTEVLESRKDGLGGAWFTAPGESSKEAFMRRLKRADPAYEIYEAYAAEHSERWAGAKALSVAEAMAEMPEIERKYQLECAEYDSVIYGINDEFAAAAKLEQEQLAKLADVGGLQPQLDNGGLIAIADGSKVTGADALVQSLEAFEAGR